MRSLLKPAFLTILLVAGTCGRADELAVKPEQFDSHTVYIELLNSSRNDLFGETMARYDAHISARPDDVQAAVEQCRFLEFALYDSDEDYNPMYEEFESCISDLESNHGDKPAVLELLLSQQWGEEAETFYLERIVPKDQEFAPVLLARVHTHLSSVLQWVEGSGSASQAAHHAREAMALDPTLNLFDVLASYEWEEGGHPGRSLVATKKSIALAQTAWELNAPIARLIEMEEFETARDAIGRQHELDPGIVDTLQQAQIFSGLGDFASARTAYDRLSTEQPWREEEILKDRFQFELSHGDSTTALIAYDALRDLGIATDPVLRSRLDLLWNFPGAAWSLRDLFGLFLLFLSAIGVLLLPLFVIAPLHYVTLLRLRRRRATPPLPTIWGLRHAYFLIAGYLMTAALGAFFYYPDAFLQWINSDELEIVVPDEALLSIGWLQTFCFALGLAAIVRFRHVRDLWSNRWRWNKTLGLVMLWLIVGRIFAVILSFATNAGGTASYLESWLLTFGRSYGALPMMLLVAAVIPVLEELAFRGVLLDASRRYFRFWIANLLQSLAFASIHEDMSLFLFYIFFGMVTGEMRRRSNGLVVPIIFHAANNFLAASVLIVQL